MATMQNKGKYYITTAIAYTSGKPHIGNNYEIVLADSIARYKRKDGYDVFFQTGTDEHGQKIELKAAEAGVTPKELVDSVAGTIRGLCDLTSLSAQRTNTMRDRCRRSLSACMTRARSTRGRTRECTARPVSPSGRSRSSGTASARTAGAR